MNKQGAEYENPTNKKGKDKIDSIYKLAELEKQFKAGKPIHDWTVLVRVIDKHISPYENERGSGIRLNLKVLDRETKYYLRKSRDSDIYDCVCFNQDAEFFDQIFEIDKVYYISNAILKEGLFNKKLELHLKSTTLVTECVSAGIASSLAHLEFDFVKIGGFKSFSVGSKVDIIGVIIQVGEKEELTTRATHKHKLKRELEICDETGTVKCVLWGEQANQVDMNSENKVIEIKEGLIQEFKDEKHLMVWANTILKLDDHSERAKQLLKWFNLNKDKVKRIQKPLEHASIEKLGFNEVKERLKQSNYDSITFINECCRILNIRIKSTYIGCSKCNKKIDVSNNNFCQNCKICDHSPKRKIVFELRVFDTIDCEDVTCFHDSVQPIYKLEPELLFKFKEEDDVILKELIESTEKYKKFKLKIRATKDHYGAMNMNLLSAEEIKDGESSQIHQERSSLNKDIKSKGAVEQ